MFAGEAGTKSTAPALEHSTEDKIWVFLLSEAKEEVIFLFLDKLISETPELSQLTFSTSVDDAQFIILNARSEQWAWQSLRSTRSRAEHFLKPILVICETEWNWLADAVDEIIVSPVSRSNFVEKINHLSKLHNRLQQLDDLPKALGQTSMKKLLLLRHLFSRDPKTLLPQRNYRAKVGYTFSLVQLLLGFNASDEINFLGSLLEAQLLNARLLDKVNICPHCEHTQINFREVCPKCGSLNISDEPTIHHFRCANVGRESQYQQGMKLVCPKCSNELRHIGVDYDKPAEVIWCNNCSHNFSEPQLSCYCLACGATFGPEDAHIRSISEYSLSEAGYRAAEEGVLPGTGLMSILKKELGFYKNEVFAEYLRIEIARCRRYKYASTLANFKLKVAHEALEEELLKHSRKFRKDFAAILSQTYRTSDIFTDLSNGDILIIFTNTDSENSKIAFKRLAEKIKNHFDIELKLQYKLFDLRSVEDNIDDIWEKMK